MNIDDEIYDHMASELSREVDAMLLYDMYKDLGWTQSHIDPWKVSSLKDVEGWIKENCKDSFFRSGNNMLFKSAEDAAWYNLRWL